MEQLSVNLKNCYGINKLSCNFGFKYQKGSIIYASNGTMKTSFAKSFLDISDGNEPSDKIYFKPTTCNIKIRGKDESRMRKIEPQEIFVIESFKDEFDFENISRLLVNKDLKNRYDKTYNDIRNAKTKFIGEISSISKIKRVDVEKIILEDFSDLSSNFFEILEKLETQVIGKADIDVQEIKYTVLFDNKVLDFLKQENILDYIQKYTEKYSELIDSSDIFEKNVFTHNNASNVNKELDKNGFFKAKHEIRLKNGKIVTDQSELDTLIAEQKEKILSDDEIKEMFNSIDSDLDKNNALRDFKVLIGNYQDIIIPKLNDIAKFKKEIWISIFNTKKDAFWKLLTLYKDGKTDIENIISEALAEKSIWKEVVDLFNKRFLVPFTLSISNQDDIILNNEAPMINFIYGNGEEKKEMSQEEILRVLSTGEKRALYLLNILYEIEFRKKQLINTLIIADDIADSFDYQNKYAIVEYLNDILENDSFRLIILTHNFDFYRTAGSRLGIQGNSYVVLKNENQIRLKSGTNFYGNVFQDWKDSLHDLENIDKRKFIASIPFVRNLTEYSYGTSDEKFNLLTSLLHIKNNTKSIQLSTLKDVYKEIWNLNLVAEPDYNVYDLILTEADNLFSENTDHLKLENKIILSVAIRLIAEEYMISNISDRDKIEAINDFQTRMLFNEFRKEHSRNSDYDDITKLLEQVNLMTPENIHLNSFMYEPILDMDDDHLKYLYHEIKEAHDARDST